MQFLAQNPVHVVVRSEDAQYNAQGRKVKTLKRRVFAKFNRGIPPWAVPIAEANFDFGYMPPERSVQEWCGFYDSEADLGNGWEDPGTYNDPPELHEAALRMGVNLFVYAVTSRPAA